FHLWQELGTSARGTEEGTHEHNSENGKGKCWRSYNISNVQPPLSNILQWCTEMERAHGTRIFQADSIGKTHISLEHAYLGMYRYRNGRQIILLQWMRVFRVAHISNFFKSSLKNPETRQKRRDSS